MKIYRLANDAPVPGPTPIIKKTEVPKKIHLILYVIPITTAMGFLAAISFVLTKNIYLKSQ